EVEQVRHLLEVGWHIRVVALKVRVVELDIDNVLNVALRRAELAAVRHLRCDRERLRCDRTSHNQQPVQKQGGRGYASEGMPPVPCPRIHGPSSLLRGQLQSWPYPTSEDQLLPQRLRNADTQITNELDPHRAMQAKLGNKTCKNMTMATVRTT